MAVEIGMGQNVFVLAVGVVGFSVNKMETRANALTKYRIMN